MLHVCIFGMNNGHIFQSNLSRTDLIPQAAFWSTTHLFHVDLQYIIKNLKRGCLMGKISIFEHHLNILSETYNGLC